MSYNLNSQQQEAVSHVNGPLQVIAGPGSGKTFVIVEKVKNLVTSGIPQSAILCMTFTEKAAGEMRQRLEKFGILDAKINTFHSFAKEILEDNFIESGLGKSTKIFKKTSQLVWCIRNTDRFNFNTDYLDIGNNQVRIYTAILEAISSFKEEMISPDELQNYIIKNLKKLKTDDQDDIEVKKQLKFFHRLNEFNKVYHEYEKYRDEKNLIDFDDMVTKAISLLEKDLVILQHYLDKFNYILVDEFQDNNYSQLKLVKILGKGKNVTVVGDDDQCIMRFQGAYFGIFRDFQNTYPDFKRIELSQNYRSTKNIVNLANSLLEPIPNREAKSLFSKEEEGELARVVKTPTEKGEVEYVAKTIRTLIDKPLKRRDGTTSPITFKDIAILSRRKVEGQKFTKSLRSFGIPATFIGETNIFTSPAILDLVSFLNIANSPTSSGAEIYRLLKSHGISEQNIAILTNAAHKKARHIYAGEQDFVLDTIKKVQEFDVTQKSEITELIEQIDKVVEISNHSTISELVYKIMFNVSDLYKKSVNSDKAFDKKNILLLNKFYEITQEYQDIYPTNPLSDFLEHISIISNFEIEIEDIVLENTVNVLTMHKSKGKQFPIVFVTDLADGRFPGHWRELLFTMPTELMKGVDRTADSEALHIDEERRLFYVAMTRAMNLLFLLYPKRYSENVNEKPPSQFLRELDYENNSLIEVVEFEESSDFNMEAEDVLEREKADLQREATSAINQLHLTTAIHRIIELSRIKHYEKYGSFDDFDPTSIMKIDVSDLDFSSDITGKKQPLINKDEFTLSPSSIKAYDDCPLKFKFQKILRVPQPASVATDLGTVIHAVTEEMANEKAKGQKLDKQKGIEKLKEKWIFRSYQNKTDENRAMNRAEQMIDAYLKWENSTKNTLVETELPFEVKIGEITFTGRIDRLEKNKDGKFEIVDFKSGSSVKSKNKAKIDPQLNIYAKAVEKIKGELPVKASLFYVEKDKMVEYDVSVESVKEALEPIEEMTKEILKENFEPTPSTQACMFCSYQSICDAKILDE
ncbi:MAG: ATP-dependent helicase [Nitrosarchaeum sp.]|nr:ATP-dependent helicase [Nitrosarchaeum sp.]